jgi:hypothetical protein
LKLIIPEKLVKAIDNLKLKKNAKNQAYSFIDYLMEQYLYDKDNLKYTEYISIPSQTLRKDLFTKDYYESFMKPLCKKEIIERYPFHFPKDGSKGKCFGYKINMRYLDFNALISVDYKQYKNRKAKSKPVNQLQWVIEDLKQLDFDTQSMINYTVNFDIDSFVERNDEIKDDQVEVVMNRSGKTFPVVSSMEKVRADVKKSVVSKDIIKYKGEIYIEPYHKFKKRKETCKKLALFYAISRIESQDFYASRNETNNRLDTNLTNLDKVFFENSFIKLDGEDLSEIDLKNAQPTLLCYILRTFNDPNHPLKPIISNYQFPTLELSNSDVQNFMEYASSGLLYEKIGKIGNWERSVSKKIFLRIMFSKPNRNFSHKTLLASRFPSIIQWMNDFKKLNSGSSSDSPLSDLLQKMESATFIDDVYYTLKEEGYHVFSKHDCILCKESDREKVKQRMVEILDKYGFMYKLS